MSAGRSLFRRSAVVLAAVSLMSGALIATTNSVPTARALSVETEFATATVRAEWATGGFAKNTGNSYNNFASYPARTTGVFNPVPVHAVTLRANLRNSPATGGQVQSNAQSDGDENLDGLAPNFEVWTPYNRNDTRVDSCVQAAAPLQVAASPSTSVNCNFPSGNVSQTRASSSGPSTQLGVAGFYANPSSNFYDRILIVEGSGIQTSAECRPDGTSTAQDPKATWSAQDGSKIGILTTDTVIRSAPTGAYKLASPTTNSLVTGWIKPNVRTATTNEGAVWVYYKILSRQFVAPGYALSDISVQVSHYNTDTNQRVGTSELILARSECGVSTPSAPRTPINDPWMPTGDVPATVPANVTEGITSTSPAPMPNPQTGAVSWPLGRIPSFATKLSPLQGPAIDEHALTTSSPIEDATGVEVTTSAPPEGGDDDDEETDVTSGSSSSTSVGAGEESASDVMLDGDSETTSAAATTTPSASEVPTVPAAPGRMPANAEFCDSLNVDGEYADAFTTVDCDAAAQIAATRALEDYIADGTQDSRWKGFTSDAPEANGWRWAAIDQRTGHVVYVP